MWSIYFLVIQKIAKENEKMPAVMKWYQICIKTKAFHFYVQYEYINGWAKERKGNAYAYADIVKGKMAERNVMRISFARALHRFLRFSFHLFNFAFWVWRGSDSQSTDLLFPSVTWILSYVSTWLNKKGRIGVAECERSASRVNWVLNRQRV